MAGETTNAKGFCEKEKTTETIEFLRAGDQGAEAGVLVVKESKGDMGRKMLEGEQKGRRKKE